MISRRTLADAIDDLDEKIQEFQREKAETYAAYRAQMETAGHAKDTVKLELVAVKAAIRHRQQLAKDRDAVAEKDALVEEIIGEITGPEKTGTPHATRTRAPREPAAPPPTKTPPRISVAPPPAEIDTSIPDFLDRRPEALKGRAAV